MRGTVQNKAADDADTRPVPDRAATSARRLRDLLSSGFVQAPGVYDALGARIADHLGFECVYMTGFGTAAALGMADVGLVTLSETANNVRAVSRSTRAPLIADADTGYGNAINVRRTVQELERAGAAGLHLEDQTFPKKCGFFEGKSVIPMAEHVQKIRAASDARLSEDFVIIARTDALAVFGWEDVVKRANAYLEAGADLIFVDGVRKPDLQSYVDLIVKRGVPSVYNGTLLSRAEAASLGFRLQILAGLQLEAAYVAMYKAMSYARATGTVLEPADPDQPVPPITDVLDLSTIYELESRYATETGRAPHSRRSARRN